MNKWWWLFILICFTTPDGSPLWVAKEQVVAIVRDAHSWSTSAGSEIFLSSGNQFYVKEKPDQVAEKLK